MKNVSVKMKYINSGLVLISLAFFYGAYYEFSVSKELSITGYEAEGTCVDYKVSINRQSNGKETKSYYPVYEYLDDSNNVFEYVGSEAVRYRDLDTGSTVNLIYSKKINKARINTTWGLYGHSIIEIFIGLAFIGVVFFIKLKTNKIEIR